MLQDLPFASLFLGDKTLDGSSISVSLWSSGWSNSAIMQKISVKLEFEAGLCNAIIGKLYQSSSKWVPVSNKGRIR